MPVLAAVTMNGDLRAPKQPVSATLFLPDYLAERQPREKTLEQQRAEFVAFKERLRAVRPELVRDKPNAA